MRKRGHSDDSRNLVNSLSKGLRVLEAFTAERPEMTLSEVARAAAIDPGTAFRMLNTLVMLGYVARVPEGKRFRLTLKVIDLGLHAIGRSDLRELARPILRSLVGEISEAASVGVLDGADILYVERVRAGLTRLGVDIRIGTNIPAVSGVIGHAILAFLPAAERERVLAMKPRRGELAVAQFSKPDLKRTWQRCGGKVTRCRILRSATACAFWRRRCSTSTAIRSRQSVLPRQRCACRRMSSARWHCSRCAARLATSRARCRRAGRFRRQFRNDDDEQCCPA